MITVGYMETKFDYENAHRTVVELGDITLIQQMKGKWVNLLSSAGIIRYSEEEGGEVKEIIEDNPNGKIFSLGFTTKEVNDKISELNKIIKG